jgi:hypothetical protein
MLLHNFRGVWGLHMAVPDGLRVNHNDRAVFALVQAERFVDAHRCAETGGFRELLQLRVQLALSIRGAGWPRRIGGTDIVADKYVAFKRGQAVFLP